MLRIEKHHKVGWLITHVSESNRVWLFVREIGNAKVYKKMKIYIFPSDYKQKEVGAPGHKAIMD